MHNVICNLIVSVRPSGVTTVVGGSASYVCITSVASNDFIVSVQWLVNGRLLEEPELDNVVVATTGELRFSMITLDYNNTSIRCRANLTSGIVSISSESLLLVQGDKIQ